MLVAAQALQGAFGALLAPSALSLLTVTFADAPDRAKAFAIFGAIAGGALQEDRARSSGPVVGIMRCAAAIEAVEVWCASPAGSTKCVEDRSRLWRTRLRQIGVYFGLLADDDDDPQPVSFKTRMKFMIPIIGAGVVAKILANAAGIHGVVGFLVQLALVVILTAIVGMAAALLTRRQDTRDA